MYRLTKNDGRDICLAVNALQFTAITWEEFQAWLDHVVTVSDVDDLPGYIFDLLACKSSGDMWVPRPNGVFGFHPFIELDDDSKAVYWGIAYARNRSGLPKIWPDSIQRVISREEAAAALARHPGVLEWFERFFEAIGKPGELSRSG